MKKVLIASGAVLLAFTAIVSAQGYIFSSDLSVGSTGPDVVALQTALIANGYGIPSIASGAVAKGRFGSQTKAAVMAYQSAKGIPNTGFVGPLTRASLNGGSVASSASAVTACPTGFTCAPQVGTSQASRTSGATVPTGITTPGVAGTLAVSNSPYVPIGASFYQGQKVNLAGFRFKTGASDMFVTSGTLDFNVRPWLYFSSFSVTDAAGDVLIPPTPISANSFTEVTASEDYRYTSDLGMLIPHGQSVDMILVAQTLPGISQPSGTYVNVIGDTTRAVDGTGVVDTETFPILPLPFNGVASPYGSVLYNGNQTANLVASIDPTSPQSQIIQTQTGSVTNSVPLAVYDIQAQNNTATLQGLTINVGVNGTVNAVPATLSNVFNTIMLQAGGNTYYGTIANVSTIGNVTEGTVTFNSSVSIPLPLGQNVPLKIVANINQGVTSVTASTSLVTSTTANFVGVDSNFNTPTVQNGGTIASAISTFSTTAAFSVVPGSAPAATVATTPTTQANVQGNIAVTWPFTFTVSAGTSPIYISANPGSAVSITSDLVTTGSAVSPLGVGAASSTQPVSITSATTVTGDTNSGLGTAATGSYYVPSNSSRTFTVNVSDSNAGNATTDSNAIVALTGVYYSSTPTAAGTKIGTTTAGTGFTGTQSLYTLPSQVQSPASSLLSH